MSYKDRIRQLIYVAPDESKYSLDFDDLNRSGSKKAPITEYPGQDGGSVQDLGENTLTFSIRCYISGADYDEEADKFWKALSQSGAGLLRHPRWGDIPVIPSSRSQSEQFVEGARRAVFDIDFIKTETDKFKYPQVAERNVIPVEVTYDTELKKLEDPTALERFAKSVTDAVEKVDKAVEDIKAKSDNLQSAINNKKNKIFNTVDKIASAPAELGQELLEFYQLPGQVVTDVKSKVDGYKSMYKRLAAGFVEQTELYGEALGLNNSEQMEMVGAGTAVSTTRGDITTRSEAASIVNTIDEIQTGIAETIAEMENKGGFQSSYESRVRTEQLLTQAKRSIINRSLSLPTEKRKVLSEDSDPISLVWELYGGIDRLEEFMDYNELGRYERLLIPRGREVRYYER